MPSQQSLSPPPPPAWCFKNWQTADGVSCSQTRDDHIYQTNDIICGPPSLSTAARHTQTAHVFPAGGTNTIDLDVSEASAAASVLRPCSLRSCACIAQSWRRRKFVPARRAVRYGSLVTGPVQNFQYRQRECSLSERSHWQPIAALARVVLPCLEWFQCTCVNVNVEHTWNEIPQQ